MKAKENNRRSNQDVIRLRAHAKCTTTANQARST